MYDFGDVLEESVRDALEESGETLSDDAIGNIVAYVQGNIENRSLIEGPHENPLRYEIDELRRNHQRELEDKDKYSREKSEQYEDRINSLRWAYNELQRKLEDKAIY